MAQFIQKARASMERRGTVGKFTAKAKAAGEGVQQFAREKASAPGKLGKEARFAKAMGSIAKGK